MKRIAWWIALALAVWMLTGSAATAQGGITVESANATNQFPDGVLFDLSVHSDAEITSVRFRYTIPPEGANVYAEPECSSGKDVQCSFNLKSDPTLFLAPGNVIIYYWQVEDADGNKLETEPVSFVYEDNRFDWQSLSQGNLTLWYYSGSDSDLRFILQTAVEGLQRMEDLLGAKVDFPVKVFLYATAEDMQEASYYSKDKPAGIVTLGEVPFLDTALVSADYQPLDVLRHELAHIVTRQAVKGPFSDIPAWLNEGTSVYAQSRLLSGEEGALQQAIRSDSVLSVRSMTSSSLTSSAGNVSLFYAEAGSVVSFLVDTEGADKFPQLFAALKEGTTIDKALQAVYGFDQNGLDNAWRESVGLPPREVAEEGGKSTPIPQLTPFTLGGQQGGGSQATQPAAKKEGGGLPVVAVVAAALAVVVVGGLALGGVALARRRRSPPS
jgi:hypothetical protein